ncbi:protein kinase, partial [Streptomyces sp. SID2563]|uniref:protein kinase n=1 Tax=Streptomyces sp. SID2563 TaxID=2690255 RepID=UPI00136C14B8|nr:protein kinase [Streptomyces sp. SID2563]
MDDYAGRVLADRYRLPLPPSDAYELVETRAFDTYSGQEVLVRQVPLPEIVDAEFVEGDGRTSAAPRTARRPADPAVRRAIEAAQAAAQVPDHPRLDQVFDVFAEAGSLWIVSELVASRPLAALLAERPLNPYRAAEIGSDVLTALRVLHAHGWTHRNITVRTVLVCDDGRVVLTGLAAGAAEEALCGYSTVPSPDDEEPDEEGFGGPAVETGPTGPYVPPTGMLPASRGPAAIEPGRPYDSGEGYAEGPAEDPADPAEGRAPRPVPP